MPAGISARPDLPLCQTAFRVVDYDLEATLTSGQSFRWSRNGEGWSGVVGDRAVRLTAKPGVILATTNRPVPKWDWLRAYLQLDVELDRVLRQFPKDGPMRAAVNCCRGLRLLRQDPWECLASFILSSTKQIVQIQQIVQTLCERFGEPLPGQGMEPSAYSFPSPQSLAQTQESELRACKMGFRAPYLLAAAKAVSEGSLDLSRLAMMDCATARQELVRLPGVGPKIANCVLLFAYGYQDAFPVDVWVSKALRQLYFAGQTVSDKQIVQFAQTHFGTYAGYAQQYLFHYVRLGLE